MSSKVVMTPIHTNPNPRPRPQSVPPAAAPFRPDCDSPIIRATPKTAKVPTSSSSTQDLVERPYAPVLPPVTYSQERETVEALVGLASTTQLSPTTAALASSFSAINVATTHNGHHDSYMRISPEHDHSCNISRRAIHSNEYSPNTAQPVSLNKDIRSNDGSSSRARRRRRSNSLGIGSPRGHRKPYDGHILEEDTVRGDIAQPPRAPSPRNHPQVPQQDTRCVPHQIESKQHSQRQRKHLPPQQQSLSPRSQQALACRSQQPTLNYAKQTNKPRIPSSQPPRTYSADVHGFTLLRGTVPIEFAQAAANILDHGMEELGIKPTFKVFGLSLQAYRVRDEFMRNVSVHLSYLPSLEISLRSLELAFSSFAVKPTALWSFLRQTGSCLTLTSKVSIFGPSVLSDTDIIGGLPRSPRLSSTLLRISQGSHGYHCIRISSSGRSRPRQIFHHADSKPGSAVCNGGVDGFRFQQWSIHPPWRVAREQRSPLHAYEPVGSRPRRTASGRRSHLAGRLEVPVKSLWGGKMCAS